MITDEQVLRSQRVIGGLEKKQVVTIEQCAAIEKDTGSELKYVKLRVGDAEIPLFNGPALDASGFISDFAGGTSIGIPGTGEAP